MTLSDKNRKRFWAKSGNRCAISKIELVIDPTGENDESVIGEECHICARNPGGPRYNDKIDSSELDGYDNLILLSRNYHKIIDDNPKYYTAERLCYIKKTHEEWVRDTLDFEIRNIKSKKYPENNISFLSRITSGSQLLNTIEGCHGYDFDNDELENELEVELVGAFLQNAQDLGDILSDMESGEKVKIKHHLSQALQVLEDSGFWIFGGISLRKFKIDKEITTWKISVIRVLRSNNSQIMSVGFDKLKSKKNTEQPASQGFGPKCGPHP
jgi:hypothetical protein